MEKERNKLTNERVNEQRLEWTNKLIIKKSRLKL